MPSLFNPSPKVPEPKSDLKADPVAVKPEVKEPSQTEERVKPTVIMTQIDSYLHEVIGAQPKEIEDAVSHIISLSEDTGLHRLSLPEYFEKLSYDCTRGTTCPYHTKDMKGQVTNHGKFIFRWILKDKRAIDHAKTIRGWVIVSRSLSDFREAPYTLFSANGGVEIGDTLLMVMPVERAMKLRRFPSQISSERLRGQITPSKTKQGKMLMTGNPDSDHVYEPVSATQGGEEAVEGAPPGGLELQEGRDF